MLLSELLDKSKLLLNIIEDKNFNQLGMVTSSFDNYGVMTFLLDDKFLDLLIKNKSISSVITTKEIFDKNQGSLSKYGIIINEKPKLLFYNIHNYLAENNFYDSKFDSFIDDSAIVSNNAIISEKDVYIGKNTIIEDNVIINDKVEIGDNCIIRSGTIIGSNGFQFLNIDDEVIQVKSAGFVKIKNNVEIQHNCCVDRGVLGGTTLLNDFVKIDNLVHIAHDNVIGDRTFITAGVKFGGRTVIGKDCWIGINSTISNGLVIGDNVKISLGSVVTRNVESNKTVSGNFAIEHSKFINFIKSIR